MLKAEGQGNVADAMRNRLACQEKSRRPRCTGVVDVDDGDTREPHFVQRLLATSRVAVDEADIGLLDFGVVQSRVLQS